jgi:hypothetical protein
MASKKAVIKGIGAIKTIYNYFGKDTDLELLVDTWHMLLQNYSDEEVSKGIYLALRVCKYAPVPADVIEQIEALRNKKKPSEGELWAHYQRALKEVLYYSYRLEYNYIDSSGVSQGEQARQQIENIWQSLPQELKIYIGDKAQLVSSAKVLNHSQVEALGFERTRFNKTFPILQKRVEEQQLFLEFQNLMIEGDL